MRIKKISYVLLLFIAVVGCSEGDFGTNEKDNIDQDNNKVLAMAIAKVINMDEVIRHEIFSKISCRFDNDYNILLSSLDDKTLQRLQEEVKRFGNQGNSLENILSENPKLQLQMPYAFNWSDGDIEEFGGVFIANGVKISDTKDQSIIAYSKSGKEIKINADNAPYIPYLVLNINERVNKDGKVKLLDGSFATSITGIDIKKDISLIMNNSWREKSIPDLEPTESVRARFNQAQFAESSSSYWKQVYDFFKTKDMIKIGGIQFDDIDSYEPRYTKGTPELLVNWTYVKRTPEGNLGTQLTNQSIYDSTPYEYSAFNPFASMRKSWASPNWDLNNWPSDFDYALVLDYWEADEAIWDDPEVKDKITKIVNDQGDLVDITWKIVKASAEDDPIPSGNNDWIFFREDDVPRVYDRGNPSIRIDAFRLTQIP